uniref:Uncharacterized protein n=1 Tax=Trichogramma kaykai TaxID=54128 RepID=A0ABD2X4I9_9HYME
MEHVDALSRAFPEEKIGKVYMIKNPTEEVFLYKFSDDATQQKVKILRKEPSDRSPAEDSEVQDYELNKGMLYKKIDNERKLVVPKSM